ncbi:MAG: hypothetical protein UT32_C0014G0021 [Parcubacteria group bacterium GW2011_GWC2_39_14]|nr:MAG: hypothetical protein UT32_C0014G0021 [Parcubacteria group bacterium GW2011_GWC2_39_14]KKR54469.1 MAG: hypothetical protein UT91_C0015G0021 [Parcubacteria group bacterium GW2011_GWA2_40_23]
METEHDISLEEIYIPAKHSKDSYLCEDFIIYPDGKEKHGGYVLGIIEIRTSPIEESEKIIKLIVNTLKEKYYNQINTSPDPTKLNLETIFEYALQKTNDALAEFVQISHINFPLENLNYVIAVAKPNSHTKDIDFIFAQHGLINVSLLHKTKQNNYKIINVIENAPKFQENDDFGLKFFASTLNGKIYHHDTIYLATEIFQNYIPPHKVNKVLSTNELPTAIDYFKSLINNNENNSYLTYAAIFIRMQEKKALTETPVSQQSIDQLISTNDKTEKLLTPTFTLNIVDYLNRLWTKLFHKKNSSSLHGMKQDKKMRFGVIKYIFNALKICLAYPIMALFKIYKLITQKEARTKAKDKLKSLHLINKGILLTVGALVLILVGSIFWLNYRQDIKKQEAAYAANVQTVQNLVNDAQVNLIYKDENKSLTLIKQAESALATLPQDDNNQKSNYAELVKQINNIKNKLLHIEKVVPQLVAEVSAVDSTLPLAGLCHLGDTFYAYSNNNTLLEISNQTISKKIISSAGDIVNLFCEDNSLYALTNQNKLLEYKDGQLNSIGINWMGGLQTITGALYGDRLYVVDAAKEQIYKHQKADNKFNDAQTWIKNKKDAKLLTATSLSIDGNIYVLNKDGKINKFYNGELQEFKQALIEPALTNAQKIYTNLDLNNLYILEDKRIIVLNKDGGLVNQYAFESLNSPITDIMILGKDEKIILTSENKIYSVKLK